MEGKMSKLDEIELKKKFAYNLLIDPDNPFQVAKDLLDDPLNPDPNINGEALRMAALWVKDPIVVAEKEQLVKNNGAKHFLPSKEDYSRELLGHAREAKDYDTKHKFYKLYGESQGLIEKPTTNITANVQNIANRVMVVKQVGNDNDWEAKLKAQQEKLISDS
jgi:hypothetical protein